MIGFKFGSLFIRFVVIIIIGAASVFLSLCWMRYQITGTWF